MALNLTEMKQVSVVLALVAAGMLVMGADGKVAQTEKAEKKVSRKSCVGYTIIEASKGIDCYGDTIKLVRTAGFYERVRNDDPS